jgi:hypothetical protein
MERRLTSDECRTYRQQGWLDAPSVLPEHLLAPIRKLARTLDSHRPWQEMLSGVHNPFGHHACTRDAWSFLSVAESPALLDLLTGLLGPDIILWDSELLLQGSLLSEEEPRYWPVEPLAGVIVAVATATGRMRILDVARFSAAREARSANDGARYILRYMPATSHFNRDPRDAAHQRCAEARALVNYAVRPIWLVRGRDHGGNDLATGFSVPAARWSGGRPLPAPEDSCSIDAERKEAPCQS